MERDGETFAEDRAERAAYATDRAEAERKTRDIDVDHVANLSKLRLTPREKEEMKRELSAIIAFADELSAIDTEGVEPTAHVLPLQNVWREDEVRPGIERETLLENAPAVRDGCILVPKVME
ncbi:Asp-tRNA(Asn)/Glu-tRNA(Gln) amidotransferase subunit GatC [Oscillospiraceae bacterium NSJ-54]|uniref:Aspartyl/glutamyl-tRNA(Asn/Gln) amidotransferase subunit C n=2 Tax=Zongyangia hominis TaxID=2763677 RepID=A0A926ICG2_9FIRM|nr:Asp-tRNA(Asn)/Glu-tRNA(Gln) amidotransferase subunit GatC [Zongyangia hominis]